MASGSSALRRPSARMLARAIPIAWLLVGCASASTAPSGPYVERLWFHGPVLENGRLALGIQAAPRHGGRSADCQLTLHWEGGGAEGTLGPLSSDDVDAEWAAFRIDADIGPRDVVRVDGEVICGASRASLGERYAISDEGHARYCALCPERAPAGHYGRGGARVGTEVAAVAGMSIRGEGHTLVDACSGAVLADLGELARPIGETERMSEAEVLVAADRGQDVCGREVRGVVMIEGDDAASAALATQLSGIAGLVVRLGLPPYPG